MQSNYPERSLSSQVDIAPTMLHAIGAAIPKDWSGIPLQHSTPRKAVFTACYNVSGVVADIGGQRFKFLQKRKGGKEMLFKLDTQKAESINRVAEPDLREILASMRELNQLTQKTKWFMARFMFSTAAIGAALSGGLLGYVLCPLFSWLFFKDLNFIKYHHYIIRLVSAFWRLVVELLKNPDYRNMFDIPWTAPPMNAPDLKRVRVSALWQHSDEGCGLCNNCCTRRACPLHDMKQNQCKSYGSFFWRYFNCGRYPGNTMQIHYYECKKWERYQCLSENE